MSLAQCITCNIICVHLTLLLKVFFFIKRVSISLHGSASMAIITCYTCCGLQTALIRLRSYFSFGLIYALVCPTVTGHVALCCNFCCGCSEHTSTIVHHYTIHWSINGTALGLSTFNPTAGVILMVII
jgi:hypothetical protein